VSNLFYHLEDISIKIFKNLSSLSWWLHLFQCFGFHISFFVYFFFIFLFILISLFCYLFSLKLQALKPVLTSRTHSLFVKICLGFVLLVYTAELFRYLIICHSILIVCVYPHYFILCCCIFCSFLTSWALILPNFVGLHLLSLLKYLDPSDCMLHSLRLLL
jgi:hypothetical protein